MAELLVLNRNSWMDELDEKKLNEYLAKYPKTFPVKYNSRQQKGDIVEIRDDGFFTGARRGYDKTAFDVVIVKGKTAKELMYLRDPLCTVDGEKKIMLKKFKYNVGACVDKQEISLSNITEKVI